MYSVLKLSVAVGMAAVLAACGGGGEAEVNGDVLAGKQATYTINGRVSGLSLTPGQPAPSLILTNQRTDGSLANRSVTITGNGAFTFGTAPVDTPFALTITSRPLGHGCQVRNGNSSVTSTPMSEVEIACIANTYSVGGTVWGLGNNNAGLRLRNGTDIVDVAGDGPFSLLPLANVTDYNVEIDQAHSHYECELENPAGRINAADVSNIVVTCAAPIRVSVTGFAQNDADLVLTNTYPNDNGVQVQESLAISSSGVYEFRETLPSGRAYNVRIPSQHADYACTVANGVGTVGSPPINIAVNCTLRTYAIGGTINGLGTTGTGLVLRLVSPGVVDEQLPVTPTGSSQLFSFPTELPRGASFDAIEVAEPDTRICTFANGTNATSGAVTNRAPITNIVVNCIEPDPLSVVSANIAAGATDIAFASQPSVEFSANIDATTVSSASINVQGPYGIHPVGYTVTGNRITLIPTSRLLPSVQYQLNVTPTLRGTNKQRIQSSYTVPFTTASGWSAPEVAGLNVVNPGSPPVFRFSSSALGITWIDVGSGLSVSGNNSTSISQWGTPQSVVTSSPMTWSGPLPNGDAMFIWNQPSTPTNSVAVARYMAATNQWSAVTTLSSTVAPNMIPRMSSDLFGNVLAVWSEQVGSANQYYSRYLSHASQNWAATQPAPLVAATSGATFSLFDAYGDAISVSIGVSGGGLALTSNKFLAQSGAWTEPRVLQSNVNFGQTLSGANTLTMRIDSSGNALALWQDSMLGLMSQRYLRSTDSWDNAATTLSPSAFPIGAPPRVRISSTGNAVAVWRQGNELIASQTSISAHTWSTPIQIESDSSPASVPETIMDNDGNVIAIWSQGEPGSRRVYSNRLTSSLGTWGPTALPISAVGDVVDQLQYAMDSAGNCIVVWIQDSQLYVSRYDINLNFWSPPYLLENSDEIASKPSVFFDSQNGAFVGWFQGGNVMVRRFSY